MSQYFFLVYNGDQLFLDNHGADLDCLADARFEATAIAREIMDEQALPDTPDGWRVEICDERGTQVDSVSFKDANRLN